MIIYKIQNLVNKKIYIGQSTSSFENRYRGKWWSATTNRHLKSAAKKYGKENFSVEILEKNVFSIQKLNELEQFYICKFNCIEPLGYNILSGGKNYKISELERLRKGKRRRKVKDVFLKNQKTGEIVKVDIIADFAKLHGLKACNLSQVINEKVNSCGYWTLPDTVIRYWIVTHSSGITEKVFDGEGHLFCDKYNLPRRSFGKLQAGLCVDGWAVSFLQPTINEKRKGRVRKFCRQLDSIKNGERKIFEEKIYIKNVVTNETFCFIKKAKFYDEIISTMGFSKKLSIERLLGGKVKVCEGKFSLVKKEKILIDLSINKQPLLTNNPTSS